MKIIKMRTNHVKNPIGFDFGKSSISFITSQTNAKKQIAAQIQVAMDKMIKNIIFDTGKNKEIDSLAFELPIELLPQTRYYWRVTVWADNGEVSTSDVAWFETGKMENDWTGKWITPDFNKSIHPILTKDFEISKNIISARAYICGLGLYEFNLNGKKVGDEYFTPNYNAYNRWIQYQIYDITENIKIGINRVDVLLGNGWYKGRFGFSDSEVESEIYGDKFALLCEIFLKYEDGTQSVIESDSSWNAKKSNIIDGNIYDGEIYDATFIDSKVYEVKELDLGYEKLKARLSLPVKIKEKIKPIKLIRTPANEDVLDMGQNMVGWIEFRINAPKGTEILLQFGEVLQQGNFFRDNLRSAKAEYKYIADGNEAIVRPYFTYYGFRYVKISGWVGKIDIKDFTGCVIYSDIDQTGYIETSNKLVNKLFQNSLWGQKGNFLDTPTDCPQRDERMGWTGDAQMFSGTACFNMGSYAFFNKYCYDMMKEQEIKDGNVPHVVPTVNYRKYGSSAWGDAATIIPWNLYIHYGDKAILKQQFESMKSWVDYIRRVDEKSGSKRLWSEGFHYGDWLALDGEDPTKPYGGTDTVFISSAYYMYSANLVAKAAKVLGKFNLVNEYELLANQIKNAIRDKYFNESGQLTLNTQTAYVISLFMDIVPDDHRQMVSDGLKNRLKLDNNHLKTGFVGTPYLCRVLSENNNNELSYTLLLNEDYPSWLYAVTMGATTIWERWNSIMPDGMISDTGMNSLNHYAYGSIVEWIFRNAAGINPLEATPGFRHALLVPQPDSRLKYIKASLDSAVGIYESNWEFDDDGKVKYCFTIPFNASATVILPDVVLEKVRLNNKLLAGTEYNAVQSGENVHIELPSGIWEFI